MPGIERIGITGFRRLKKIDLQMRPLMVMIGANGAGKTSFMDAISVLAASTQGNLNNRLNEVGGTWSVITRGESTEISFNATMATTADPPLEYNLHIAPHGTGYTISEETLYQIKGVYSAPYTYITSKSGDIRYFEPTVAQYVRPEWEYNWLESALSQLTRNYRQPESVRRTLNPITRYHVLDVGRLAPIKLPQQLRPAMMPGENGEDFASFLYNLRESNHYKYEAIEDSLRASFSGFESLGFPIIAAGMVSITWKERGFNLPFYMHELSEGTLRFLWLASLLQSPHLPAITMIDEPEVSLHPELLAILADLLREASDKTQLIVATHSDRLIRFLEPHEVVVMDICEDGGATMTWGDSLELEGWLKDYSLDEVWQMGEMGGRA
jgi:predicted ATPase